MKIALHGHGKMGKAVEALLHERGHELKTIFDSTRPVEHALTDVDVIIDFSNAAAVRQVVAAACASRIDLVIGTTGWSDEAGDLRREVEAAGIGAVYASNFSPGANVVFALARRAGELFRQFPQYAAGVEERHHAQKKDAPSGTAIRLARAVEEGSGGSLHLPIASSRVGKEFGLHTLFFDSEDDLIELSHRARGRNGFARGAIVAAELIRGKQGLYSFEELIGL